MSGTRIRLHGRVERLIFRSPDGSFRIVSISTSEGSRASVVVRDSSTDIDVGMHVEVVGNIGTHPRFGRQIEAASFKIIDATPIEAVVAVLSSDEFKGIGPRIAERLARSLGEDLVPTLNAGDPKGAITNIIGKAKRDALLDGWQNNPRLHETSLTLAKYGIGNALRAKIMQAYPNPSYIVEQEPYRLYRDIPGVGFRTADRIAQRANIPPDSPERLAAGIIHSLEQAASEGHTGLTMSQLAETTEQLLGSAMHVRVTEEVQKLLATGELRESPCGLVQRRNIWRMEQRIAANIIRLMERQPVGISTSKLHGVVDHVRRSNQLTDLQAQAVMIALTSRISVVTGGPGTGKTRTISSIVTAAQMLYGDQYRIALVAPTGKAADRLSQATERDAATIHRTLGIDPATGHFLHDEGNPYPADLVILDEASMIDTYACDAFLRAMANASIVFVGDPDQLPSVDAGRILLDLIHTVGMPVTRLTEIFRQSAGSMIAAGAEEIKQGRMPKFARPGRGELVFIEEEDHAAVAERIVLATSRGIPDYLRSNGLEIAEEDIQVISPGKNGVVGTLELKQRLQNEINPGPGLQWPDGKPVLSIDGHEMRARDRVICNENIYGLQIFNGDIGHIVGLVDGGEGLHVRFSSKDVIVPRPSVRSLGLAYALTVHKAQGSEYPVVLIPITTMHYKLLRRTLLYTAITRAKFLCVLIGSRRAVSIAINQIDGTTRQTAVLSWIRDMLAGSQPRRIATHG